MTLGLGTMNRIPEKFKTLVRAQVWPHGPIGGALDDLQQLKTEDRKEAWRILFTWALPPEGITDRFEEFVAADIPLQDLKQIARDVPRTRDFFQQALSQASDTNVDTQRSDSFAQRKHEEKRVRQLERVLRAYVAYVNAFEKHCAAVPGTDPSETSIYIQGLNGIAYLLLEIFDNEVDAFAFLVGITRKLLTSVFCERQLHIVEQNWDRDISLRYPDLMKQCKHAGLMPGLLCVKWLMTMFTQVSFSGGLIALPLPVLLSCWDLVMLMGHVGVAAVILSLFECVAETIRKLPPKASEEAILASISSLQHLTINSLFNRCRDYLLQPEGVDPLIDLEREALRRILEQSPAARELAVAVKPRKSTNIEYQAEWNSVREVIVESKSVEQETLEAKKKAAAQWIQQHDPSSGKPFFVHVSGSWQWEPPVPGFVTSDGRLAVKRVFRNSSYA